MFRTCKDTFRIPVTKESANTSHSDDNPIKKYYCEFCDDDSKFKVWELETDLEIHRRQCHKKEILHLLANPDNFMCSVCLHKQSSKEVLIQHIKSHHLLSPPNATRVKRELFICDYCNRLFFNKQLLSVHIEALHLLSDTQKMTATTICPACNLEVTIKSIWFHFLSHGIIHSTTCPICVRTFDSTHEVLEHIETHPGYYNCCICLYQSKKERHFLNHINSHKKTVTVNYKRIHRISKYFVPQKMSVSWTGKFLNIFKGITLASEVKICILCQTMCVTDEEMLQHIYGDHSPSAVVGVKRYLCLCGEEFFNNILLKYHVFTLKGDHKVFNGTREELDRLNQGTDSRLIIDTEMETMATGRQDLSKSPNPSEYTEGINADTKSRIGKVKYVLNIVEENYDSNVDATHDTAKSGDIPENITLEIQHSDISSLNKSYNPMIGIKDSSTSNETDATEQDDLEESEEIVYTVLEIPVEFE